MLGLLTISQDGTYLADVLPMMIPLSIGMGLTFVPVTLLATSGLQADVAGLASGLFNTSQQIGGALGLAILSTISVNRTDDALADVSGAPTPIELGDALVSGFKGAFFGARHPSARRSRPPADDAEEARSRATSRRTSLSAYPPSGSAGRRAPRRA